MRFALLIDAENLSHDHAADMLSRASGLGALPIRRAYGHAERAKGWTDVPGIRFCHVASAKNAADMAICIAALDLLHRGLVDGIAIASSDGDFTTLALHLRESGVPMHGYGESKAPASLRAACSSFHDLPAAQVAPKAAVRKVPDASPSDRLAQVVKAHGGPMPLNTINAAIRRKWPDFKISAQQEHKNWRACIRNHPDRFTITGSGPDAKVTVRDKA